MYDKLAETAMEGLLDELQNILDSHGDSSLEVEYNVRPSCTTYAPGLCPLIVPAIERGHHSRSRPTWYICDQ
jgi:hypothetical protein